MTKLAIGGATDPQTPASMELINEGRILLQSMSPLLAKRAGRRSCQSIAEHP
jgi:hypothetical protein